MPAECQLYAWGMGNHAIKRAGKRGGAEPYAKDCFQFAVEPLNKGSAAHGRDRGLGVEVAPHDHMLKGAGRRGGAEPYAE